MEEYIAGAIGGCSGLIVGHPFDTIKVNQQAQKRELQSLSQVINSIRLIEIKKGFFRGLCFPLISYGFINSAFFGTYGRLLESFKDGSGRSATLPQIFAAGSIAGGMQLAIACPADFVKVVLQSQICKNSFLKSRSSGPYFSGPWHCVLHLYKRGGLCALYRGLFVTAIRDIPAYGTYICSYEWSFERIMKWPIVDKQGIAASLLAGGWAGVLSWAVVMPCDVIKTRVQADFHAKMNTMEHAKQLYSEGGIRIFYRGMLINSVRAFPVNAVTFLVYEQVLKLIKKDARKI